MKRIVQIGVLLSSFGLVSYAISQSYRQEPISPVPDKPELTQKARLGKGLFSSKLLSTNNLISCQSCHQPRRSFSQPVSGRVQTTTLLNVSLNDQFFWDGRAKNLTAAIKASLYDVTMMNNEPKGYIESLKAKPKLVQAFDAVYDDGLTEANLLDALEQYLKTLVTPNAPFDQYLKGDKAAISDKARKGYELFKSLGCISCHQGVNVGGNLMQKYGVYQSPIENPNQYDFGYFNYTNDEDDKFVFRVPSLRNVEFTRPYMHNGSQYNLKQAIQHMGKFQLNQTISDEDASLIEAFLQSLSANEEAR